MSQNELIPTYSSSDDEEEEASGSEDDQSSGSDSDSPSEDNQTLIPPPYSAIKPDNSSEPEESGSDTDSDPDPGSPENKPAVVDPNIKPIRSVPMEQEELNLESELAPKSGSGSGSGLSPALGRSKRPAAVSPASEKDVKKPKSNSTDEDSKKQLFQRLWSEDDEIVILKGMIDYKAETGENLIADMGAFHEFIKKNLHVDVSRAQLVDKIRRLKKKYVNNVSKEKDGKDRSFSKSHEQKGYELSKLIWGGGSYNSGIDSKKNKSLKNGNVASSSGSGSGSGSGVTLVKCNGLDDKEGLVVEVEKSMDISRFVRYGGGNDGPVLPEEIVKAGMELAEGEKRVELEERWRKLKKEELQIYLKKMDLVKEQALMVLDAVNSS